MAVLALSEPFLGLMQRTMEQFLLSIWNSFLFQFQVRSDQEIGDAVSLNHSGWEHLCHKRYQEAIQYFSRAIEEDENFAEAYNHRWIAKQLAPKDHEDIRDDEVIPDEDMADALTLHDPETQKWLQQQRKWMCVGFDARGEPQGETKGADADFLISFASPDRDQNNRILHELKSGVSYNGQMRLSALAFGCFRYIVENVEGF